MIHFITYGDNSYYNTKQKLCKQAQDIGWFNTITCYGPRSLDNNFKGKFQNILNARRGGGYWIWKPYIVKNKLDKINDGDILIYLDAGCYINKQGKDRFNEYIEMLNNNKEGIISFKMEHSEKCWTTKEIFQHFNIELNSDIANSGQFIATILIIKKNNNSVKIIDEWYETLLKNPLLFTDYYNKKQNEFFTDNRHDQSILSIIRKKYKSIIINDETYFKDFNEKNALKYPFWATRFNDSRKREI